MPLDVETVAAGMLSEAVAGQHLSLAAVEARLGPQVAGLIEHILRVKRLPSRVDLYDDVASRSAAVPQSQTRIPRSCSLCPCRWLSTDCEQLPHLLPHSEGLWRSAANAARGSMRVCFGSKVQHAAVEGVFVAVKEAPLGP